MLALRGLIEEWYPDLPVSLLGHSMGGLISAHLLLELGGVSGAMRAGFPRSIQRRHPYSGSAGCSKRYYPSWAWCLDANGVSRDPAVVADYLADPLVYNGKITTGPNVEMLDAMEVAIARAGEIDFPLYRAWRCGRDGGPGGLPGLFRCAGR